MPIIRKGANTSALVISGDIPALDSGLLLFVEGLGKGQYGDDRIAILRKYSPKIFFVDVYRFYPVYGIV